LTFPPEFLAFQLFPFGAKKIGVFPGSSHHPHGMTIPGPGRMARDYVTTGSSKKHGEIYVEIYGSMGNIYGKYIWEIYGKSIYGHFGDRNDLEMRRLLTEIGFLAILATSTVHKFPSNKFRRLNDTCLSVLLIMVFRTNRNCC